MNTLLIQREIKNVFYIVFHRCVFNLFKTKTLVSGYAWANFNFWINLGQIIRNLVKSEICIWKKKIVGVTVKGILLRQQERDWRSRNNQEERMWGVRVIWRMQIEFEKGKIGVKCWSYGNMTPQDRSGCWAANLSRTTTEERKVCSQVCTS